MNLVHMIDERGFKLVTVFFVGLLASLYFAESAEAVKFLGLSDLPGGSFLSRATGVSANGSVVVGYGIYDFGPSGAEAFRWTSSGMVGLGFLPGGPATNTSQATGVSADGSVVVGYGNSASGNQAFRWTSSDGMVGLDDLPDGTFNSQANGVSGDGSVVVGQGVSASGPEAFRWTSGAGMVGLGDLAGGVFLSAAFGVSADGSVVVGYGNSASGTEAFRLTSGTMFGLGDLPGGVFTSAAIGASADGSVIVGQGNSASGFEAFRWTSGGMVGLGDLPGGPFNSQANGVSADGSVVIGSGATASGTEAFVWDAVNGMRRVRDVLSPSVGAALNGWTLTYASAVSADGRTVVGHGTDPNGNPQAWLAYLSDAIYWFPQASASWDAVGSWSGPFAPGPGDDVVVDPTTAVTVSGPATSKTVKSLLIGGSGVGRVTLRLAGPTGGDLQAVSSVTLASNAELALADGRILSAPSLTNSGLVHGTGTVNATLQNLNGGEVRVAAGESLVVSGGSHDNAGKFEAIGGSLEFIGAVTNDASTGLITGQSATIRFNNGLTNNGSVALSAGLNNMSGDINNKPGATITVTGGANAVFYDDVIQSGTLRVTKVGSTTSTAVILGAFSGAGGSTGGGDIFFEGDLRPGNSPASVTFGNNVGLGSGNTLTIELGGTTAGTQYDQVHVTGQLALDGTLNVSLIDGFIPLSGQPFDILDWGSLAGTFAALQLPALPGSLAWNTSQLYTAGILSVGLPGDYNGNGVVDAADYVVWRKDPEAHGGTPGGYNTWRAHFGQPPGSGVGISASAAIPEPSTLALFLVGMLSVFSRRDRAES